MSWTEPATPRSKGTSKDVSPQSKNLHESRFRYLNFRLSYIDFPPECVNEGGLFTAPVFEPYSALVDKANIWLLAHSALNVVSCETVEFSMPVGYTWVDSERMSYCEYNKGRMMKLKGLRMWLAPKSGTDPSTPERIRCVNIVPKCLDPGGRDKEPKFDSFPVTLGKLNNILRKEPLNGRIVTAESVPHRFIQWMGSIDPEESTYVDHNADHMCNLYFIRIIYVEGQTQFEEIETHDFVPQMTSPASKLKAPKFANDCEMMEQVSGWAKQQMGAKMVHVQTLNQPLTDGQLQGNQVFDSEDTFFKFQTTVDKVHGLRVVRVYLSRPSRPTLNPARLPPLLSVRTFLPVQLNKGGTDAAPGFETMADTMNRIIAWTNITNVSIMSVETLLVTLKKGKQIDTDPTLWTYSNKSDKREFVLSIIRVYIVGSYIEPSSNLLPPLPATATDNEAAICTIA